MEKNNGGSALEPVKSRKPNVEAVKLGKSSDAGTAVVSDKLSKGNGTFRGKGFGNTKTAIKGKWWLNLPYVLVCPYKLAYGYFLCCFLSSLSNYFLFNFLDIRLFRFDVLLS